MIHQAEFDQTIRDLIFEVKASQLSAHDESTYNSYQQVLRMLSSFDFSNRTNFKGALSHFIIDSYKGDRMLGGKLIEFDRKL